MSESHKKSTKYWKKRFSLDEKKTIEEMKQKKTKQKTKQTETIKKKQSAQNIMDNF